MLSAAFREYGLALELDVAFHSFFFTHVPDALTQPGQALRFYGVALRYAPTPQAKGKVEREDQCWQHRLPAYIASEPISDLEPANVHRTDRRRHRNPHATHRELPMTLQKAWDTARQQKRSVRRPAPRGPWWPLVWRERVEIKVAADGHGPIGTQRRRIQAAPASKVVLCHHPSGHHSVLAAQPHLEAKPQILFTHLPKPPVCFC